jgi:hypothetical protein
VDRPTGTGHSHGHSDLKSAQQRILSSDAATNAVLVRVLVRSTQYSVPSRYSYNCRSRAVNCKPLVLAGRLDARLPPLPMHALPSLITATAIVKLHGKSSGHPCR